MKQALKRMDQIHSYSVIHLKGLVTFQAEQNEMDLFLSGTQTSTAHEKNFTFYNLINQYCTNNHLNSDHCQTCAYL